MNFDLIPRWDLVAMCVAMAILFVLEMLGVFGYPNVTITAIVRLTPRWMLAMVWGWLGWHFLWVK
jgi:hypothetical protein